MADYTSWKVTDLKAELKKRGIPQTGLRLKQQFIDKLAEEDAKASTDDTTAAAPSEPITTEDVQKQTTEDSAPQAEVPEAHHPDQQPEQHPEEPHEQAREQPHQQETPITKEQPPPVAPVEEKSQEEEKPDEQTKNGEEGETGVQPEKDEQVEAAPIAPSDEVSKAKPAEQAPASGGDVDEASQEEPAQLVDKSIPSAPQTSGANTEFSTPLPIEEALEDKRKRKRRSQSPGPTPEALAAKKARAQEETTEEETATSGNTQGEQQATESFPSASAPTVSAPKPPIPPKQDARFRGLFASAESAPARAPSPPQDIAMEDADVVEPAQHVATAALYIDGLMRPLQPAGLRNHLISLASAPGAPINPEVVHEFYLDPIKTHCFVRFSDVQAASRVRSAVHGKVWPNERNRKDLWADFIPEERVQEWIQTEEASRNRAGAPVRWEVHYDTTEDGTTATLAEAGPNSRSAPAKTHEAVEGPPLGSRGNIDKAERQPPSAPPAPSRPGQGFKPLDELFKSTTAKPKLYYVPVARSIADKRLDQFDELLRKGSFPRRGGDEMRRITFEDDDYFVDIGPEYGRAAAQRRQERGGRGGRGRGSWRGGG